MIGIVIVTHGYIGRELLAAWRQITGEQLQAEAIGIGLDDDMDVCRDLILAAVARVNGGQGVIMLTDMFGGTPSNLALSVMPKTGAMVLAGVNLPVLVKLASVRTSLPLLEAARAAEAAGRKYLHLTAETLPPLGPHPLGSS